MRLVRRERAKLAEKNAIGFETKADDGKGKVGIRVRMNVLCHLLRKYNTSKSCFVKNYANLNCGWVKDHSFVHDNSYK